MSAPTETVVQRRGNHLLIAAPHLARMLRELLVESWDEERRAAFEEFVYAEHLLADSVERDACSYGPPQGSDETERLAGEADERWADLDVSGAVSVPLADAWRLYELLGAALGSEVDGYVGRLVPAVRSAA